jgi:hypothetical protein
MKLSICRFQSASKKSLSSLSTVLSIKRSHIHQGFQRLAMGDGGGHYGGGGRTGAPPL